MLPANHVPLAAGISSHFIHLSVAQHEQTFHCRFHTAVADAGTTFSYIFTMLAQSNTYVLPQRVVSTNSANGELKYTRQSTNAANGGLNHTRQSTIAANGGINHTSQPNLTNGISHA